MIQATLRMNFAPQKFEEAVQILQAIIERTKAKTGCTSCSVFQDRRKEYVIVYEEKWQSNDDLQHHLRSEEYKNILLVMEMAETKPEIQFDTIVGSSGVETIEMARMKK